MRALALRLGAASTLVFVVVGAAMAQRMERGAFLRKPANSRAQLVAQVKSDPVVSARYQRHFGMSEEQVTKYFSGMRTSTLPQSGRYLVWHVEKDGALSAKWLNLKKGMQVFLDQNGRVALKLNCGNPMVDSTVAKRTIEQPRVAHAPPPVVEEVAFVPTPPSETELVPPPAVVVPEIVAEAPPEVVPAVIPPAAVTPAVPTRVATGGGGGFSPWPLLLLGGAFVGGGGGGGGGSTPPPVPEPGTLIALGAGAAMVMARRRKAAAK